MVEWTFVALLIFVALSLIYYQLRTGVPPFPASSEEAEACSHLLRKVNLHEGAKIYELGCGWGGLALSLARDFPEAKIIGLEISWIPYLVARWRARKQPNLDVYRGDFYEVPLKDADAVVAYLMISPMPLLAEKLDQDLKEETPVATVAFFFRDREPSATVPGRGLFHAATALYLWPAK